MAQSLLASFQSVGCDCLSASKIFKTLKNLYDPLNQPVILTAQFLQKQGLDNEDLTNFVSHYLAVIVLDSTSAGNETFYFRLGASDILEPNINTA